MRSRGGGGPGEPAAPRGEVGGEKELEAGMTVGRDEEDESGEKPLLSPPLLMLSTE